jgi:hypothetical protein
VYISNESGQGDNYNAFLNVIWLGDYNENQKASILMGHGKCFWAKVGTSLKKSERSTNMLLHILKKTA